MIRATSLAKHFGSLRAVDGIDLDIAQGEFFAFLGPNAAGKTTTIKMLAGLLRPTVGRVEIGGVDIQAEPERAKSLLAYVPDFPFLYDKLTSTEFVQFVGELYAMDRRTIDARRDALFERFHLDDYAHELTENLSHGTRQRLVIASALLHDPRVLIIDEPMVGLDPMHARIVKEEFKARAQSGVTIFLSTHQLSVAEEVADRIAIIHRGRIIALGSVAELRAQSHEAGGLERVFLSLIDAEEQMRNQVPNNCETTA
ncbi:MAG TPA: ABC transporter ATP-binding protein [Chthoniobacteraceae bacterium]|nr:ABC transporter ATP-binding protein [Chthoniobacteraceae bacterium]